MVTVVVILVRARAKRKYLEGNKRAKADNGTLSSEFEAPESTPVPKQRNG